MEGTTATSSPTPSERPSFAQAFASNPATESLSVTPSSETTPVASASAETTPPSAAATTPDGTTQTTETAASAETGPIPFERHKAVLDKAYQERDGLKQELEGWKQYDWAKSVPRETFDQIAATQQRIHTDPVGFVSDLIAELQNHETYGPQFRSNAARLLASGRSQPADVDLTPDVAIHDAQGRVVGHTLSDKKIMAAIEQGVNNALGKEVAPLKAAHEKQVNAEKQRAFTAEVERLGNAEMAKLEKREGFTEHAESIWKAMEAHPDWSARDAYDHVYDTEIAPKREARIKESYDKELKTKAASSSMNPSTARVTTPTRPKDFFSKDLVWK